jgi:hypothetical protein
LTLGGDVKTTKILSFDELQVKLFVDERYNEICPAATSAELGK